MATAGTDEPAVTTTDQRRCEPRSAFKNALLVAATVSLLTTGCSLIDRVRGEPEPPPVPELSESSLSQLLLSAGEINSIVDGPGMEASTETSDELGSGPADISNEACLGAAFPALRPVYSGGAWTATERGSVIDSEGNHGVLQAVVLFRSADRAQEFFESSRETFETCAGDDLEVARGTEDEARIEIGPFTDVEDGGDTVIAQQLQKFDGSLDCQHALGVVANLVADVEVCFSEDSVADEAEIIVTRILATAEDLATEQSTAEG